MSFLAKALKPKAATSSNESVSDSTSTSGNSNNGIITSTYAPQMQQGVQASNVLGSLLGIPGSTVSSAANDVGTAANGIAQAGGAQAGYQNYLQNAGYQPAMTALSQGITGTGAASGLLQSGATSKALVNQGGQLNNTFFNNYLQNLSGVAGQGLQAGSLVSGTGNYSNSTSHSTGTGTSNGGGPSTLGSIASTVGGIASIFSDRRLKTDIEKVAEFEDGLGVYNYRYKGANTRHQGVMADEVERLRPWALGPKVYGFATVNYGAL